MVKRNVLSFLYLCAALLLLSACGRETPPAAIPDSQPTSSLAPSQADGSEDGCPPVEWITPADDLDMQGMNLFWRYDHLYFAPDSDAKLSIYVHAEPDASGNILFDDGQDWAVVLETSLGNYPLFLRQYVQFGGVSCVVFIDHTDIDYAGEDRVFHILVNVQQTAGYVLYDCVFDEEEKAFRVTQVYAAEGINFITDSKSYQQFPS